MKNIFKIACLFLAVGMTSCYDTMDDKAVVEENFETVTAPTVTLSSVNAVDFQNITASATVSNVEGVLEVGFMYSSNQDFTSSQVVPASAVESGFETGISGLQEQTTYYVRAYAFTAGSQTVLSEPMSVTTPKAPIFDFNGEYVATEISLDTETGALQATAQYEIAIEFTNEEKTEFALINLWESGAAIYGTFDAATGIGLIPTKQVLLVHPSYGDVWATALTTGFSSYQDNIVVKFTALGGKASISEHMIECGAGYFGYFMVNMEHK